MKTFKKLLVLTVVVLLSVLISCKKPGDKNPKLEEVNFSNMITSMIKGEVFEIDYSKQENVNVTFVSSNTNVATVEGNNVTATNIGSFTLTATFTLGEESKKYEFVIEVKGQEFTINYELNGGKLAEGAPSKYQEGVGVTLVVPTYEGYEFLGWTLSSSSSSYITEISSDKSGNVTLYANWKKLPVYNNITYNLDGGKNPNNAPASYEEGVELTLPIPTKEGYEFLGWSLEKGSTSYVSSIAKSQTGKVTVYANWEVYVEPELGDPFDITYELNGGAWSWTAGNVSAPASGIDSISNLPEIFMADFYTYLFENNLLSSEKVAAKLHVSNWTGFSSKYGDPVAWYNATSTGGYSAADGYSELFFNSVNDYCH